MNKAIRRSFYGILAGVSLILAFTACQTKPDFSEVRTLAADTWSYQDTLVFQAEHLDTSHTYDIYISIDHLKAYAFENLYIRFGYNYSGIEQKDTLSLDLISKDGVYIGDCNSESCQIEAMVKRDVQFKNKGAQRFTIEQFTREKSLEGIREIGLTLRKSKKSK